MGLADSGLTDAQPATALFDESAGGQITDLLPVDRDEVFVPVLMRSFLFSCVDSDLVLGQRSDQLVVGGEQRALQHVQSLAQSHVR